MHISLIFFANTMVNTAMIDSVSMDGRGHEFSQSINNSMVDFYGVSILRAHTFKTKQKRGLHF
jgi:hypothetical protein